MSHTLTDDEAQTLLDLGVGPRDIVRLGFPDATDDFAEWFLWEKTAFPLARGVHDLADSVAHAVMVGPRCDDILSDRTCRNRVSGWGERCWRHREVFV